jgi:hypothetical protein
MLDRRSSGFGTGVAPHGFAVHFDPMCVVNEAVEDGIGVGWVAERFMMLLSWKGSYCNLAL